MKMHSCTRTYTTASLQRFTKYKPRMNINLDDGEDKEYILGFFTFQRLPTDDDYTEDLASTLIGTAREKKRSRHVILFRIQYCMM